MTITENKSANSLELVIGGRLDTGTAPELEAKLKQIAKDTQTLYLNLANVQYISSAGLRVVLLAHKLMLPTGGKMIIRQPSAFAKQVLEATGMDSIHPREHDRHRRKPKRHDDLQRRCANSVYPHAGLGGPLANHHLFVFQNRGQRLRGA